MSEKWGILNEKWRFYQPLSWFPSDSLLEWLVFFHIYILAAWLAIREALFDKNDQILKLKSQLFAFPRWTNSKKPSKCRNILLIGADGTIGSAILKVLREHSDFHCHVVVHHLNRRIERVCKNDNKISVYEADLIDKEQVLLLASKLKSIEFEVAIFAAGIMLFPEFRTTDGVEMHNAVNVVGQLMLFELLQNDICRAIFLSSATARMACYSKSDLLSVYAGPYQAYASSKLNLAIYVNEMARRRHVSAVSLHPGTVPGRLYRFANPLVKHLNATLLPKILRSPEMSAVLVLHTVFREDFQIGQYYEDTETIRLSEWLPQQVRNEIYETVHRRIEMWMEN